MRLGERWNASEKHWPRVKSALRTRCCLTPPLYGLLKNHRSVPGGESINGALSVLLTEVLTIVGALLTQTDTTQCRQKK